MKRTFSKLLCLLLVIATLTALVIPASAAGTPSLTLYSGTTYYVNDPDTELLFRYTPANTYEAFYVAIVDANGNIMGELGREFDHSSGLKPYDWTIAWNTTGYAPGKYTIEAIGLYHNGYDWQVINKDYVYTVTLKIKNGWQRDYSGRWLYGSNNAFVKNKWLTISGKTYYFDAEGYMLTGWQSIGGKWYYLKNDMKTGWQKVGANWYYLGTDGVMHTGWLDQNGTWYYMNSSGAMVTGTQVIGGKTYKFNASGVWIG